MNRYEAYRDSGIDWIGEIPKHWNLIRGKFLFQSKKERNANLKCQNLLSLTMNGVLNKDSGSFAGLRPETYETYQIFQENDLVFKMIDLENVNTSRVGIVHEEGIMSSAYIRHEPKQNKIFPKFGYWFYFDLYRKKIYNSIGNGVRSSLLSSDLLELRLPLPPLAEQNLIARYLDKKTSQIDSLAGKLQKKIELLKEQRTARINQAVTKGLDPDVEMKDSGVEWMGGIPKHWEVSKLKYISKITYGISPSEDTYNDEGVGTLLINGPVEYSETDFGYTRSLKWTTDPKNLVSAGILLFCLRGSTTGRLNITHANLSIGRGVCSIEASMNQNFLVFCMMMIRIYIQGQISGSTFPSVTKGDVDNFLLPTPPLAEQKRIARYLDKKTKQTDSLVEMLSRKIELLKEYRQALISSVVTGKVQVTEDMI